MCKTTVCLIATIALLLAPSVALAHHAHGYSGSLLAGFIHPFNGIDHLLAMAAVGLFAAHLGGRALWAVPATFVAAMALGAIFGASGVSLPFVETALALSVLIFGFVILSRMAPPVAAAMALVEIFAIFHGYAHGNEMPADSSRIVYGTGFMIATTFLHGLGITLGLATWWFDEVPRRRIIQTCGIAIGLIGAGLIFGLV